MSDDLISVAWVGNEHEAAMVQALFEELGIPSMQRRRGIDGTLFGHGALTGGGSREVMVHPERVEEARALLAAAIAEDDIAARGGAYLTAIGPRTVSRR